MTSVYQRAYQARNGTCSWCRRIVLETDLFLAANLVDDTGWKIVCEECDEGDGSLRFHGRTIVELRDVTAFGSAEFDLQPTELIVCSMFNPGWQYDR